LRADPLLAALCGKADPTGQDRVRARDRGHALAGKSTLNRLELTPPDANAAARYKKFVADAGSTGGTSCQAICSAALTRRWSWTAAAPDI
jgi:hypothetical protein